MDASFSHAVLFAAACFVLLLLPFAPAWLEWRHPSDAAPLPIPRDDAQDPLAEAENFRQYIARVRPLGPNDGYEPIDDFDAFDDESPSHRRRLPILACNPIRAVGGLKFQRPLYVTADVEFRESTGFTDVMSEGRLRLGARSRVSRWAHADAEVRLGEGSVAARRLTSRRSIRLEAGCCFLRVHAPAVHFGTEPEAPPRIAAGECTLTVLETLPGAVRRTPGLWRIDGDCSVPRGRVFTGSLIVTGRLFIAAGSRVEGSVKAYRGIVLGEESVLTGAAVCAEPIHVLHGAVVGGPLVTESHLLLRSRARLGHAHAPTTVSAAAIVAEEGAIAHGTVCAQAVGIVAEAWK